jgi:hypothetical protein
VTRHVVDALTAITADLSIKGRRVRDIWRVEYEVINRGRQPISDLSVMWSPPNGDAAIVAVDSPTAFVVDELARLAERPELEPGEKARIHFYVDSRKKPAVAFTSTSSAGAARVETPRVPEEDVVFYVIGFFAAVQTIASALGGSVPFTALGAFITGFACGIPGGFHMVRRWRDEGSAFHKGDWATVGGLCPRG